MSDVFRLLEEVKAAKEIAEIMGVTASPEFILGAMKGELCQKAVEPDREEKPRELEKASDDDDDDDDELALQLMENNRRKAKTDKVFSIAELLKVAPDHIIQKLRSTHAGFTTYSSLQFNVFGMSLLVPRDNLSDLLIQMGVLTHKHRVSEEAISLKLAKGTLASQLRFHNGLGDFVTWFLQHDFCQRKYGLVVLEDQSMGADPVKIYTITSAAKELNVPINRISPVLRKLGYLTFSPSGNLAIPKCHRGGEITYSTYVNGVNAELGSGGLKFSSKVFNQVKRELNK